MVDAVIGVSPFFANYGLHPETHYEADVTKIVAEEARITAQELRKLHEQMRMDIEYTNLRTAIYYNNRHKKEPDFKEGDKVYLLRRNLRTKRPCEKLDSKKLGPFMVLKKLGKL